MRQVWKPLKSKEIRRESGAAWVTMGLNEWMLKPQFSEMSDVFQGLNGALIRLDRSLFMSRVFFMVVLLAVCFLALVWNPGKLVCDAQQRRHVSCLMWAHRLWFTFDLHLDGCVDENTCWTALLLRCTFSSVCLKLISLSSRGERLTEAPCI